MDASINGGTQQPWVFLLKMIILGCFGGTPIFGNTHISLCSQFGYAILSSRESRRWRSNLDSSVFFVYDGTHRYWYCNVRRINSISCIFKYIYMCIHTYVHMCMYTHSSICLEICQKNRCTKHMQKHAASFKGFSISSRHEPRTYRKSLWFPVSRWTRRHLRQIRARLQRLGGSGWTDSDTNHPLKSA